MACKLDVKKAILDTVFRELTDGRYTFNRMSDDTIQVNGKVDHTQSRANTRQQAVAIANELAKRTEKSFNGHVTGFVSQLSEFDPVTVRFSVSDKYVNHVYSNLPNSEKTDNHEILKNERDYVNSNTGPNTYSQIELFSPEENAMGTFAKFIEFKKGQLLDYQKRLGKVQSDKRKSDVTTQQLRELNNLERELKLQIEGKMEIGVKGLKQEIAELSKNADVNAVGYYVEKDLQRLQKLANSNDVNDINEAERIIDFYNLAGSFNTGVENPFFTQEEIFLEDENDQLTTHYRLSEETMKTYKDWRDRALSFVNTITKRKQELAVNVVNSDPSVNRTYGGKKFTFDDMIKSDSGLKDTDWISMWTMDVTQGIFSQNGIIPQVMFSYLANSFEKKLSWARKIEERIDKMNPGVQKELIKLGYSLRGGGILGLKGANYNLFKETTKEGRETGGLVQRYVKEFFDENSKVANTFYEAFTNAQLNDDYGVRSRMINKAFEDIKRWRRNNTVIMDIGSIPEITNDPEFKELIGTSVQNDPEHKKQLTALLGEKGYKEEVEKQKKLLRKYISEKASTIDSLLIMEGKDDFDSLSDKAKSDLSYWESNHHPLRGIEDYNTIAGISFGDRKANNFMDYNSFIPRKYKTDIKADPNGKYSFTDTSATTGFHNDNFKTIEDNPTLSEFYDTIKEVCDTIRDNMPYELQEKMAVNTIPALMKTSTEIISDKNTGILSSIFLAYKHMIERIRLSFGINKQSELSYAVLDPITGKSNYKVNDTFIRGNSRAVEQRMQIEKMKFLRSFNLGDENLNRIGRFTTLHISRFNNESLLQLAQLLNVDISLADINARRLDKITNITTENVQIGKYIRDFSVHSVVQTQSFDLGKIAKYFSNMTMEYAARQEALPILEILKDHYESIQRPNTNNLGRGIYNARSNTYEKMGLRTNAIKQMDDWFERVALGNYDTKHLGPHGLNTKVDKLVDKRNTLGLKTNVNKIVKGVVPKYYKDIYSKEDKKKLGEIQDLLKGETDKEKIKELESIRDSLGRTRTATAAIDNFMAYIRTLRLGYNVSGATTNFLEGVTSNVILASLNEYFDPKEMFYGYHVIKHSFVKNATFGLAESGLAKKNRSLMDKFNVIMDSKNELQKSSVRTYASKFSWLNPHALNQRVEYINQSPIMIAMLRTMKITDKNGKESSIWDAFEKTGHLKDDFRTEDNVRNWEELQGEDYLNFKQKLHKAIVLGHGNYDELRGMMIKSSSAGKAIAMFKTWLPMQLYWRFATEQDDIQSGTTGFKGRYWSYGTGTAMLHGAAVGTAMFALPGTIIGGVMGAAFGRFFGVDTGVSLLRETGEATLSLVKKMLGFPVNIIAGKQIINTGDKDFESWVGKGKITAQDAKNLRGNMADISMQLAWLAMILLAKSLFWDDDDDKDDAERKAHNIIVNKLMALSTQAAMYVEPATTWKSAFGDIAVLQYLIDFGKEVTKIKKYMDGDDVIPTGVNAGQSALANQTKKTFLPGLFKDGDVLPYDFDENQLKLPSLGFKSQSQSVFQDSPFQEYFKSQARQDKESNQRDRAVRKIELKKEGYDDKDIRKILDDELPTPKRLKKLDETRDEYNQERKE